MSLNILIIGGGGREHALAWKLAQSPSVNQIFITPGNGGTMDKALHKVQTVSPPLPFSPDNFSSLQQFAQSHNINLVVPGPEQPIVDGITSVFESIGIPVFGPSAKAAVLEGSKVFAKQFMERHNIPTARFATFNDFEDAKSYLTRIDYDVVIKADGIAAGKGVLIPNGKQEAIDAVKSILVDRQFGAAGDSVVIEEFIEGQEISILTITDGYTFYNFPAAQDHKRIGENDTGLNTGGMGAYAPAPVATGEVLDTINREIIRPTIDGMRRDRTPFVGLLFTGIMLTEKGPKVLEYNVRFGDPETQTVLPLLSKETDLAEVLLAAVERRLDSVQFSCKPNTFATTVVLAAGGYPKSYKTGDPITIDNEKIHSSLENSDDAYLFHAGTKLAEDNQTLVTAGGRVIAATAVGHTLRQAVDRAYQCVDCIDFKGKYFRRDIAHRAFKATTTTTPTSTAPITYASSGVSVDKGNELVQKIKNKVKSTQRPGTSSDIGGFGGIFDLKAANFPAEDTLLVAATDGVGTKLLIAQEMNIHNTVGIDLVAMNVNDLVVQGAEPLFFLDYFATGSLDLPVASDFVSGVADGCLQAGCALIGGETSEMPGMYSKTHYDTNGTAVGAVFRGDVLPRTDLMQAGDVLLGLPSNGVHSNGYSLVRKLVKHAGLDWKQPCPWNTDTTVGEDLLVPTKIYVKPLLPAIRRKLLLGLAHITGGGLVENVPRALPETLQARIDMSTWTVPDVFKWFGKVGNIPVDDILRTFNMGIGMVLILKQENVAEVKRLLKEAGESAYEIGRLVERTEPSEPGCIVENAAGLY